MCVCLGCLMGKPFTSSLIGWCPRLFTCFLCYFQVKKIATLDKYSYEGTWRECGQDSENLSVCTGDLEREQQQRGNTRREVRGLLMVTMASVVLFGSFATIATTRRYNGQIPMERHWFLSLVLIAYLLADSNGYKKSMPLYYYHSLVERFIVISSSYE